MTTSSLTKSPNENRHLPAWDAGQDLIVGLTRSDLWGRLGWLDVKRRYRRTALGPFWTSISLAVYALTFGMVATGLWHQDYHTYLPFVISGLIVWTLISTIISESCNLFIVGNALFRNIRFEYSILVYQLLWRNLIVFLHNFIVYILIVIFVGPHLFGIIALAAVPGIGILLCNGSWVALLCGMFCLRFRDVQSLVATVVQISMLITPILWPPDVLLGLHRLAFVEMNPLYHMIEIVRAPLLGRLPSLASYAVTILIALGGWILTYFVFQRFKKRIAYWS
jgi:ABC-type polysaccharide/polyol phosphate export permease